MLSRRLLSTSSRAFQSTVNKSPLQEYDRLISLGKLKDDPYQRKIISNLGALHQHLCEYTPPKVETPDPDDLSPKKGLTSKIFGLFKAKKRAAGVWEPSDYEKVPKGIYLYGDVGCGKTMLMDLFYSTIPAHLTKKRLHFHQFMQNLHKRSHQLVQHHGSPDIDVTPLLAAEMAQESTIFCFDEFQVTDVADAMLLRRIIEATLAPDHGLVLFATSNRAPNELYINGIQRQSFIPCIKLLEQRTEVIYLNSPTDYRKIPKPISSVYWSPKPGMTYHSKHSVQSRDEHVKNWYKFFSQDHEPEFNLELTIWGRKLNVPKSCPPYVAQFSFDELCGKPLAAGDYLSLATTYNTFIVTDVPYLSIQRRDLVRRFITFLDAVYDNHGRLCVTSAAPFEDLFVEPEDMKNPFELKASNVETEHGGDDGHVENDELVKTHGFSKKVVKHAKMFQLDEERFAFARALSRLSQMSTQDWVDNNGIEK